MTAGAGHFLAGIDVPRARQGAENVRLVVIGPRALQAVAMRKMMKRGFELPDVGVGFAEGEMYVDPVVDIARRRVAREGFHL